MPKILRAFLSWTLILCACTANGLSPAAPPSITAIATVITPTVESSSGNSQQCAYQWAQQALPELSDHFQESIQSLQAEAKATAFAFGENCIHTDGTKTFLPMETDFNVTLQVNDLSDVSALGGWIVNVMQIVQSVPTDQIVGPRPGRVSLLFQSNNEQKGVSFYIDQYRGLPSGLNNAEIYQRLQTPQ